MKIIINDEFLIDFDGVLNSVKRVQHKDPYGSKSYYEVMEDAVKVLLPLDSRIKSRENEVDARALLEEREVELKKKEEAHSLANVKVDRLEWLLAHGKTIQDKGFSLEEIKAHLETITWFYGVKVEDVVAKLIEKRQVRL
jgi:hypothetical protein